MLAQVLYNCAWMKALGYVINDLFWIVVVVCFSFCFVFVCLFVLLLHIDVCAAVMIDRKGIYGWVTGRKRV